MAQVEENSDSAFINFRIKFTKFLNNFLVAHNLPCPQNKALNIRKTDLVPGSFNISSYSLPLENS